MLEVHQKDNEIINHNFELIDGQQRLTSLYLMTFLGYLISIHRYFNLPTAQYKPERIELEKNNRLKTIKDYESKLFILKSNSDDDFNQIFEDDFYDKYEDDNKRLEIIQNRFKISYVLKNCESKLNHENSEQKNYFDNALKNTMLLSEDKTLNVNLIGNNEFNERIYDSFEFFKRLTISDDKNLDLKLLSILNKIKSFSDVISFCVLISESPDDSFKLFEVLNSTGRELTIIDKLKNYLHNETVNKDFSLTNKEFDIKWADLTSYQNIKGTSKVHIHKDLARSELSLISDKYYQYFTSKELIKSKKGKNKERKDLFKNESGIKFLNRIILISKALKEIYSSDIYGSESVPHTIDWNLKLINKFGYDWGRQVFLGSLILSRHLGDNNDNFNELDCWSKPNFDDKELLNLATDLEKFYAFLSDILVKIGAIGVVCGLTSDELPKTSQNILEAILSFVENEEKDLRELSNKILVILTSFIAKNSSTFKSQIKSLKYSHSGNKKMMTVLLFVLYNKGKGVTYQFSKPSLEHLEPKTIPEGSGNDYFKPKGNVDRNDIIDSLGNLLLIQQKHNSKLRNIPLKSKLNKIQLEEEFRDHAIYNHDIFKNLLEKSETSNNAVYEEFPDSSKYYTKKGVPKPDFFELRLAFYVKNISNMFCNHSQYLLSGDEYLMPNE